MSMFVSMFLAILLTVPGAAPVSLMGERIQTKEFDGIVVYPGGKDAQDTWVPTRAQIVEAEAALRERVPRSDVAKTRVGRELSKFKRQYHPIVQSGDKRLRIVGFHESQVGDGRWLLHPSWVSGGGDYFFFAVYSFNSKRIAQVRINAPK